MIAYGGGKRLIGSISNDNGRIGLDDLWPMLDSGSMVRVETAFNFLSEVMAAPGPGGQVMVRAINQVAPLDASLEPATVYVRPEYVRFFHDMSEDDRKSHEQMVTAVAENMKQAVRQRSAENSGLVLAGPEALRGDRRQA